MPTYGYTQPKYGTGTSGRTPFYQHSLGLAQAASGAPKVGDPFGLLSATSPAKTIDGGLTAPKAQPSNPSSSIPQGPVSSPPPAAPQGQQAPQAPSVPAYDLNTDPALQQVNAFTGLSDQQAQAAYDKQRRDLVLQSGLESLAKNLFPGDASLAQAAAKNPTSQKAQLDTQRTTGLRDLLNALTTGGHNLGYSGYRTLQEQDLGNQYQNALAGLAGGVQSQFDQLLSALNATRQGNAQSRASALGDAYQRMLQGFLSNPPVGPQEGTTPDHAGATGIYGTPSLAQALIPGGVASRLKRFAA